MYCSTDFVDSTQTDTERRAVEPPRLFTYSEYLAGIFPAIKVQKISVNAGFNCPNRDGTISRGGCIYCLNTSFTPGYCMEKRGVTEQLEEGKRFFSRKYPSMKYLAYFQSYTNTFGGTDRLERLYREAMEVEDVVGLVVGTRPDCVPTETVDLLSSLARELPVFVELGAESSHDATLRLINRGHGWREVAETSCALADAGVRVGLHLIAGLPGEGKKEVMQTLDKSLELPVDSLKFHQLQILKGTPLERMWREGTLNVRPWELEEYLELCAGIVRRVDGRVCLERFLAQAPPGTVAAPSWGLKNHEFMHRLRRLLDDAGGKT